MDFTSNTTPNRRQAIAAILRRVTTRWPWRILWSFLQCLIAAGFYYYLFTSFVKEMPLMGFFFLFVGIAGAYPYFVAFVDSIAGARVDFLRPQIPGVMAGALILSAVVFALLAFWEYGRWIAAHPF